MVSQGSTTTGHDRPGAASQAGSAASSTTSGETWAMRRRTALEELAWLEASYMNGAAKAMATRPPASTKSIPPDALWRGLSPGLGETANRKLVGDAGPDRASSSLMPEPVTR